MSQTSYNINELKENLKQLILNEKSHPSDLSTLVNNDADYFTLLAACFKPEFSSTTNFFDSLHDKSTFQHAHFGYLLYLASSHNLSLKRLSNEFDDEALGNWCEECFQALKGKISPRQKVYLANRLPKENSSIRELVNKLNKPHPSLSAFEGLSLCFSSKNKQFLQHLYELCEIFRKKSLQNQRELLFSSMISFYTQAQKVEIKQACRDLIQEFYFFEKKENYFNHQNLVNAWNVISKAYEQGKSQDREDSIQSMIALSLLGVAFVPLIAMLVIMLIPVISGPMPALMLALFATLAITSLIAVVGAVILAFDKEMSARGYRSNHSALTKAMPQLTFFHKEVSASNDLVVLSGDTPTASGCSPRHPEHSEGSPLWGKVLNNNDLVNPFNSEYTNR